MNARKGLVLDANILIRAVFGQRVRQILEAYEDVAGFYSPDVCFQDAGKYIPDLSERRGFDPAVGLSVLDQIGRIVEPVDRSLYEDYENLARERVLTRDPDDWPIVAVALLLDFPIWTEDQRTNNLSLVHKLRSEEIAVCDAGCLFDVQNHPSVER